MADLYTMMLQAFPTKEELAQALRRKPKKDLSQLTDAGNIESAISQLIARSEIEGWRSELETLVPLKAYTNSVDNDSTEQFFDCGHRIKEVRLELGLNISELVELLGYSSERRFRRIEEQEEEAPVSLLQRISDLTGATLLWLKHGKEEKYTQSALYVTLPNALYELVAIKPIALYLCTEPKNYTILLVAKLTECNWPVFDLGFDLKFWDWADDYGHIPYIYVFIDQLHRQFPGIAKSVILTTVDFEKIAESEVHPRQIINLSSRKGRGWADDLRDVDYHYHPKQHYEKIYGPWFTQVQNCFREYHKTIKKIWPFYSAAKPTAGLER